LQPYTTVLPKPLMPVGDYPILEIVIRQLRRFGFRRIILTVGYHYELFQAFFQDGRRWGIQIDYSLEDRPLGTAGPIRSIKNLDENFLVMNGDTLTDLNYRDLYNRHIQEDNIMTLATKNRSVKIDYGVIRDDKNKMLNSYIEKPRINYLVSIGVAVMSKKTLGLIPEGKHYDLPDLVNAMIRRRMPIRCYHFKGFWLDIGRPEDYRLAVEQFRGNKKRFLGNDAL
jgi:NDP-sugar pyrophosphorylase family protein